MIRGEERVKVWVALFTCLVSRAVHMEVVPDVSGATFIYALQNMAALFRTPELLISDNATNFTMTNRLLQKMADDREVINKCAVSCVVWKFIPVKAAWYL